MQLPSALQPARCCQMGLEGAELITCLCAAADKQFHALTVVMLVVITLLTSNITVCGCRELPAGVGRGWQTPRAPSEGEVCQRTAEG